MSSQSTLTQHQIRRIQAYYASQAGVNYVLEALRLNDTDWVTSNAPISHYMCRSNTGLPPCDAANLTAPTANRIETDLPRAINYVLITVGPLNPADGSRTLTATANYTNN
jgi:hypothetical protein